MASRVLPFLITGSNGRIGRLLRVAWPWAIRDGLRPVWQARSVVPGYLPWDILNQECPPGVAGGIILALAGRGAPEEEVPLALRHLETAALQGARHVFLTSSAAVYGPGEALKEEAVLKPVSAYGRAKADMEDAALAWKARHGPGAPGISLLRIGNVVGAGSPVGPGQGPVTIGEAPAGRGPLRSWIGPNTLAALFARFATMAVGGVSMPEVVNVAAPVPRPMADLLDAAGIAWTFGAEDPASLPCVTLHTARLTGMVKLPPPASSPRAMVGEWRFLQAGT